MNAITPLVIKCYLLRFQFLLVFTITVVKNSKLKPIRITRYPHVRFLLNPINLIKKLSELIYFGQTVRLIDFISYYFGNFVTCVVFFGRLCPYFVRFLGGWLEKIFIVFHHAFFVNESFNIKFYAITCQFIVFWMAIVINM